jgi:hypothetical protein
MQAYEVLSQSKERIDAEISHMQEKSMAAVLKEHTDSLMALLGVVGTGQGVSDGKPCIGSSSREPQPFSTRFPLSLTATW